MNISGVETDIPKDFSDFFVDGVPINRKAGIPKENDVYNLYLGLRTQEIIESTDNRSFLKNIVRGITNRLKACGGLWSHRQWPGSVQGNGLRSAADGILILVEGYRDGLIKDVDLILSTVHRHLSFNEPLGNGGLWFYHDSFESSENAPDNPQKPSKNSAWGSSNGNALVLNTHVYTLLTIMHILRSVENLPTRDSQDLSQHLEAGLKALEYVLQPKGGLGLSLFQSLDSLARKNLFQKGNNSQSRPFINGGVGTVYFNRLRPFLKGRFPCFQFKDGYLERDIGYTGMGFNYHIVNTWDLARLAAQLEGTAYGKNLAAKASQMALSGLQYVFSQEYRKFLDYFTQSLPGYPILICEILFTFFQRQELLNELWIQRYVSTRRTVLPTPAILGYDPLIINRGLSKEIAMIREFEINSGSADILILSSGRYLIINFSDSDIILKKDIMQKYQSTWRSESTVGTKNGGLPSKTAVLLQRSDPSPFNNAT